MQMYQSPTHIRLSRRGFLGVAAGLISAGVLPKSALAFAAPTTIKQGAYDLTVLTDGFVMMPWSVVSPDATPEQLKILLSAAADAETHMGELNVVLAKSGDEVILFDTGTGANPAVWPLGGKLVESLTAAGVAPEAVTKVVFTHAHPDHLFGAMSATGAPTFANASYFMAENEMAFWTQPGLADMMPKDFAPIVAGTQGILGALRDKFTTFKTDAEVLPGIRAIDTAGHTPGHVSFEFAGGDGLVLVGDAITVPQVFFANPEWTFGFDADIKLAGQTRRKLLDFAAQGKKRLLGYHWAYPGLGMAEAKDGAFVYVPAV